jgi:hypothetical protein
MFASASFAGGYLSNALSCNGTTSMATYSAQDTNQITVAAWVRAGAQGNSQFPRMVDAPGYRLMFRFGSADVNSVGFATTDGVNGDWDSGGGSISLGAWYHVAASYDRSNRTNLPAFYVNGIRLPTVALAMPSGTQAPYAGTGYIGNRAALDRAWSGLIDDVRLYNRLLTDTEVRALVAMPPANLAPVLNAGASQIIVWPGASSLSGTVTDDGQPNPPGMVTTTWSEAHGPGLVAFANSNALTTTASFSVAGNFLLRLVADDGQVAVSSDVSVTVITRPAISCQRVADEFNLSWPTDYVDWRLQVQTNSRSTGLNTHWMDVPDATATNQMNFTIDPAHDGVYYRLVYP